jgi:hypothetical protein
MHASVPVYQADSSLYASVSEQRWRGCNRRGIEAVQAVLAGGLPERSRDGRHGLIELEPRYCDVAVQRWQEWSGGTGSLEGDRRTFAERTTARGQTNS